MIDEASLRDRISGYLREQTGRDIVIEGMVRFPVGFSWLTYALDLRGVDGSGVARQFILRIGPDYGLYAPYSALPQVLALQSLVDSPVPVPRPYWFSDDSSILGAPFLFCQRVSGTALLPWASASLAPMADAARVSLAEQFIAALAAMHRVDWRAQPIAQLADGASTANTAEQQLRHWQRRYERCAARPYPLAEWGLHWLREHRPTAPALTIVHGDYRTGNFLEQDGRITAILDWELAHIGDPHEDLGWASLPMYMGGTKLICRLIEPQRFFDLYQQQVPFTLNQSSVQYYRVLSLFKLAATHMAAAYCFERGNFNDMRMPAMGSQVMPVLRQMEKAIEAA